MINAETLTALKELVQSVGPLATVCFLGIYIVKRLIDAGYELQLKPTKRRPE